MKGLNISFMIVINFFSIINSSLNISEQSLNNFTHLNNGNECSSSFQCLSGCCFEHSCQIDTSKCEAIITKAYIISGCIFIIVLGIGIIYLFNEIRKTKINVANIRQKQQNNIKNE